jgi:hypothetical protein
VIRYALACSRGHAFDGWFAGSDAFDKQRAREMLACPTCGSTSVGKTLMAPSVATSRKKARVPVAPEAPVAPETVQVAANVPEESEAASMLRKLRKHLTANAENVGEKFPEEARRIHYNEAEKRGIYGQASIDEARALAEEGIDFHPLPVLPEDHN